MDIGKMEVSELGINYNFECMNASAIPKGSQNFRSGVNRHVI